MGKKVAAGTSIFVIRVVAAVVELAAVALAAVVAVAVVTGSSGHDVAGLLERCFAATAAAAVVADGGAFTVSSHKTEAFQLKLIPAVISYVQDFGVHMVAEGSPLGHAQLIWMFCKCLFLLLLTNMTTSPLSSISSTG